MMAAADFIREPRYAAIAGDALRLFCETVKAMTEHNNTVTRGVAS